ncbi:outer membrane protein Iml2/Tetratricopeptide repeat protein 39 [Mucor lusitanicus]
MEAEDIFLQNKASPCHAFGYALILYSKAMLSMETSKVEEAVHCVSNLETHLKRLLLVHRKKRKQQQHGKIPTSCSVPLDLPFEKHSLHDPEEYLHMQFELLYANCILMLATLHWIDHVKAAYDLRKAYRMYERLFEALTGMSISAYQATPSPRPAMKPARRTVSCDDGQFIIHQSSTPAAATSGYHETVEHGAYFGIGIFHMIFSLLPSKVGKLLNNIGFHTSRSTAIHLLRVAYNGTSMYSSLSALVLLTFYTNISMYIQPNMNHFFLFKDAKAILQHMQSKYPNGRLWHLIQGKFKRIEGNLTDAVTLFTKAKEPHQEEQQEEEKDTRQIDAHTYFRNASISEFTQFRSFAIYETGWAHIYAGNYTQASEAFFCLESICNNWSRLFYHYIATCCMMAQGMYEKAALESIQMINMFEQKRKLGHRISSNEHYAESKVASWIAMSTSQCKSLKETLHTVTNPIWELVYLWHGTCYWTRKVISDIKLHATTTPHDPMLYLILGVLYRDVDGNLELAMEYFNLILLMKKEAAGWMYPYAMYEIAATQCTLSNNTSSGALAVVVVTDWVRCIEAYYQQHPQDKEWECRMQLRCQLLLESCCCV